MSGYCFYLKWCWLLVVAKALKCCWASLFCGCLITHTQQIWCLLVGQVLPAFIQSSLYDPMRGVCIWGGVLFLFVCFGLSEKVFMWYSWRAVITRNCATNERKACLRSWVSSQNCHSTLGAPAGKTESTLKQCLFNCISSIIDVVQYYIIPL